jgi:hypothetical protein
VNKKDTDLFFDNHCFLKNYINYFYTNINLLNDEVKRNI